MKKIIISLICCFVLASNNKLNSDNWSAEIKLPSFFNNTYIDVNSIDINIYSDVGELIFILDPNSQKYRIIDESLKRLCSSGRICELYGHNWKPFGYYFNVEICPLCGKSRYIVNLD